MPSRLKSLELIGYKTFASKNQFLFGERITCIVGPNGSGKSNIADSIRWVLGEQSFSLLRGKKTEDMIFAGSEQRPRANMAQATVTFDNSSGWLPIDFAEVSITRRAYRDGNNEYLLNGQRARLRDINELLGKVGLSERTYTIVGQGAIDTALSLKAEERRALFEEAAGIGIYRHKREDALRRLEQTQHNLERIHDILAEIKPRLKTLERQAQRARDFQQVKAELDGVLRLWYGFHWNAAQQTLTRVHQDADEQAVDLANVREEQASLDHSLADLRARISALRGQLNAWNGQAQALRDETQTINRNLAVADERLRAFSAQKDSLEADLQNFAAERDAAWAAVQSSQAETARRQAERETAQAELSALETARAMREDERRRIAGEEAAARRTAAELAVQVAERRARLSQQSEERGRLVAGLAALEAPLHEVRLAGAGLQAEAARRDSAAQAALGRLNEADAEILRLTERLSRTEQFLSAANARLTDAIAAEGRLTARAEALAQLRAALESDTGQAALRAAGADVGWKADLADVITAPAEFDVAIAAALGRFINAAVVERVEPALGHPAASVGRVAVMPLEGARAATPTTAPADLDILGQASGLVTCSPDYRPLVDALLGGVWIARSRAAARAMQASLADGAVAVTLDGELFYANGAVVLGRDSQANAASALALAREQRELPTAVQAARDARQTIESERDAHAAALQQYRADRETANLARRALQQAERDAAAARDAGRLDLERAQSRIAALEAQAADFAARGRQAEAAESALQAEIAALTAEAESAAEKAHSIAAQSLTLTSDDLNEQIAERQTQTAVAAQAAVDAANRLAERQAAVERAQSAIDARQARLGALSQEAENFVASLSDDRARLSQLHAETDRLQGQIHPAEQQLAHVEAELSAVESAETGMRATLHSAERRHSDLQLDYARKKDEIENLRRQITDDFGLVALDYTEELPGPTPLPLEGVVEHLPQVESLPEGLEDLLNRRRGQLKRMGAINPDALTEFNEVRERHEFLTTQVGDLEAAGAQLREVIAELDALMEREFRRTFDAVAEQFKDTFSRLFGGGTAKLILTEPENLTNTGIDILAKLPGRKQQGLALLSGGERALTASALLFALLKVNPPPFAMMDEVDAALDEANVGRFRDMLRELSETTQFVVITHNRNTVQAAETVYGISMGSDSASQAISLKLEGDKVVQN